MPTEANHDPELVFHKITSGQEFPDWAPRERLVRFFHETMQPYHDQVPDIEAALDYALAPGREGFLMLVRDEQQFLGAFTMLDSQMGGFIPRWILLFVSVLPETRGRGVGRQLIERALAECDGPVKLHVEYDNPAKRLYERLGFTSKYAEMRWEPPR
jgi:[ribosomal protein S18]-alanine N-acetyltransferase